jgi:NADPH:quinone reductase-like Zn-dependent oxidoreductase
LELEGAGIIEKIGPDVKDFKVGDKSCLRINAYWFLFNS